MYIYIILQTLFLEKRYIDQKNTSQKWLYGLEHWTTRCTQSFYSFSWTYWCSRRLLLMNELHFELFFYVHVDCQWYEKHLLYTLFMYICQTFTVLSCGNVNILLNTKIRRLCWSYESAASFSVIFSTLVDAKFTVWYTAHHPSKIPRDILFDLHRPELLMLLSFMLFWLIFHPPLILSPAVYPKAPS